MDQISLNNAILSRVSCSLRIGILLQPFSTTRDFGWKREHICSGVAKNLLQTRPFTGNTSSLLKLAKVRGRRPLLFSLNLYCSPWYGNFLTSLMDLVFSDLSHFFLRSWSVIMHLMNHPDDIKRQGRHLSMEEHTGDNLSWLASLVQLIQYLIQLVSFHSWSH